MPSSTLATTIHHHDGAQIMRNGTGIPSSHPNMSTGLRPQRSAIGPENRSISAFVKPKLTMNAVIEDVEASRNSSLPRRGTIVLSSPTIPPTKALISTSSRNCPRFCRIPSFGASSVELAPCLIRSGLDSERAQQQRLAAEQEYFAT